MPVKICSAITFALVMASAILNLFTAMAFDDRPFIITSITFAVICFALLVFTIIMIIKEKLNT